jgi:hypothetical protein
MIFVSNTSRRSTHAPWLKVVVLCAAAGLGMITLNDLSYLEPSNAQNDVRRLAHRGAWAAALAIALVLGTIVSALASGARELFPSRFADARPRTGECIASKHS